MITIKILGNRKSQRYAVKRALVAAQCELLSTDPKIEIDVTEIKTVLEINQYTSIVIMPSLIVNDHLVCIGRVPKKDEVIAWLREAGGKPA
jgi:hypothetical protein